MEESAGKRARGCKRQFGTNSRLDPWLVKCGNIGGRLLSPVHTWNSIVNPILRNSIETAARSNSIGVAWLSIKKERERERKEQSLEGKMECSGTDRLFIKLELWWFIFFDCFSFLLRSSIFLLMQGMKKINDRNVKYSSFYSEFQNK